MTQSLSPQAACVPAWVGADIYSPNTPPDLRATWGDVTYAPGASLADCET
jgi:hypothetical protein